MPYDKSFIVPPNGGQETSSDSLTAAAGFVDAVLGPRKKKTAKKTPATPKTSTQQITTAEAPGVADTTKPLTAPANAFVDFALKDAGLAAEKSTSAGQPKKGSSNIEEEKQAILELSRKLGVSPFAIAVSIANETAGTFNPDIVGPSSEKWGPHQGLIQFGKPQAKQHGYKPGMSFREQLLGPVYSYLKTAGVKPGMPFEQVYAAIHGGSPNASPNAYDKVIKKTLGQNVADAKRTWAKKVAERYGFTSDEPLGITTGSPEEAIPPLVLSPYQETPRPQYFQYLDKYYKLSPEETYDPSLVVDPAKLEAEQQQQQQAQATQTQATQPQEAVSTVQTPQTASDFVDTALKPVRKKTVQKAQKVTVLKPEEQEVAPVPTYEEFLKQSGLQDTPENRQAFETEIKPALEQMATEGKAALGEAQTIEQEQAAEQERQRRLAAQRKEFSFKVYAKDPIRTRSELVERVANEVGVDRDVAEAFLAKGLATYAADPKERYEVALTELADRDQDSVKSLVLEGPQIEQLRKINEAYKEEVKKRDAAIQTAETIAKQYEASGDPSPLAFLKGLKDAGITQLRGRPIDEVIAEEQTAYDELLKDVDATTAARIARAQVLNQTILPILTSGGMPRAGTDYLAQGLANLINLYDYAKGGADAVRADAKKEALQSALGRFGSLAEAKKYKERLPEKYLFRPLAQPLELAKGVGGAVVDMFGGTLQALDIIGSHSPVPIIISAITNSPLPQPKEGALYQLGEYLKTSLAESRNPDFNETYQLGNTLGQIGAMLGLGAISGGAALGVLPMALSQGAEQYAEAEQAGADRKTQLLLGVLGGLTAVSDALPVGWMLGTLGKGKVGTLVGGFLRRAFTGVKEVAGEKAAEEAAKGLLKRMLARAADVGKGAAAEGFQEIFLDKKINDAVKNLTIYANNPEKQKKVLGLMADDIEQAFYAMIGGGVGGGFHKTIEKALTRPDIETQALQTMLPISGGTGLVETEAAPTQAAPQTAGQATTPPTTPPQAEPAAAGTQNTGQATTTGEETGQPPAGEESTQPANALDALQAGKPVVLNGPRKTVTITPVDYAAIPENRKYNFNSLVQEADNILQTYGDFAASRKESGAFTNPQVEATYNRLNNVINEIDSTVKKARKKAAKTAQTAEGDTTPTAEPTTQPEGATNAKAEGEAAEAKPTDVEPTQPEAKTEEAQPVQPEAKPEKVEAKTEQPEAKPTEPQPADEKTTKPQTPEPEKVEEAKPAQPVATESEQQPAKPSEETEQKPQTAEQGKVEEETKPEQPKEPEQAKPAEAEKTKTGRSRITVEPFTEEEETKPAEPEKKAEPSKTGRSRITVEPFAEEETTKPAEPEETKEAPPPAKEEQPQPAKAEEQPQQAKEEKPTAAKAEEPESAKQKEPEAAKKEKTPKPTKDSVTITEPINLEKDAKRRKASSRLQKFLSDPETIRLATPFIERGEAVALHAAIMHGKGKYKISDKEAAAATDIFKDYRNRLLDKKKREMEEQRRAGEEDIAAGKGETILDKNAVLGVKSSLYFPGTGGKVPVRYAVVEAESVVPSHNPHTFQPNPEYPYINDRKYEREFQYQMQVDARAKPGNFIPAIVLDKTSTAETGAPVVDALGNVLGGNSRAMIIQRALQYSDETRKRYIEELKSRANELGIDPTRLDNLKSPVLVRVVEDFGDFDPQDLITKLNETSVTPLTNEERAIAESRKLEPEHIEYIDNLLRALPPEKSLADLLTAKGADIVQYLITNNVFSPGERNTLIDNGKITDDGKRRIERMILAHIIDDHTVLDNLTPTIRNALVRIAQSAIKLSRNPDWNIIPLLREAVDLGLLAEATNTPAKDYRVLAATPSFLKPEGWRTGAVALLEMFRKPLVLKNTVDSLVRDMNTEEMSKTALFQIETPSFEESFKENFGWWPNEIASDEAYRKLGKTFKASEDETAGTEQASLLSSAADSSELKRLTQVPIKTVLKEAAFEVVEHKSGKALKVNEAGAELLRRLEGELTDNDSVSTFYGATYTPTMLQNIADYAENFADEFRKAGWPATYTNSFVSLAESLRQMAKEGAPGVAYIFDEALDHETHHKLMLEALGGKPLPKSLINRLKQTAIWDANPTIIGIDGSTQEFNKAYPNIDDAMKAMELAAMLETGQIEHPDAAKFLEIFADGLVEHLPDLDPQRFERLIRYADSQKSNEGRTAPDAGREPENKGSPKPSEQSVKQEGTPPPEPTADANKVSAAQKESVEGRQLRAAIDVRLSPHTNPIVYRSQSHKTTEKKAAELVAQYGEEQVAEMALSGPPSAAATFALQRMLERMSAHIRVLEQDGKDVEANALLQQYSDYVYRLAVRQIELGREVEITKLLGNLSPESAATVAQKMLARLKGIGAQLHPKDMQVIQLLAGKVATSEDEATRAEQELEATRQKVQQMEEALAALREQVEGERSQHKDVIRALERELAKAKVAAGHIKAKIPNVRVSRKQVENARKAVEASMEGTRLGEKPKVEKVAKEKVVKPLAETIKERTNRMGAPVLDVLKTRKGDTLDRLRQMFPDAPIFNSINESLKMVAEHISPHIFNRFNRDFLNKGIGQQAVAAGVYFYTNPEEGIKYEKMLRIPNYLTDTLGREVPLDVADFLYKRHTQYLNMTGGHPTPEQLADFSIEYAKNNLPEDAANRLIGEIEFIRDRLPSRLGARYAVELLPEEDEYLLANEAYQDQPPKVIEKLKTIAKQFEGDARIIFGEPLTERWERDYKLGSAIYQDIERVVGGKVQASATLDQAGVKGVKFLDSVSYERRYREPDSTKPDTFNYVVFDPENVRIIGSYKMSAEGQTEESDGESSDSNENFPLTSDQYASLLEWAVIRLYADRVDESTLMKELMDIYPDLAIANDVYTDAIDVIQTVIMPNDSTLKGAQQIGIDGAVNMAESAAKKRRARKTKPSSPVLNSDASGLKVDDDIVQRFSKIAQEVWKRTGDSDLTIVVERLSQPGRGVQQTITDLKRLLPHLTIEQIKDLAVKAQEVKRKVYKDLQYEKLLKEHESKQAAERVAEARARAAEESRRLTVFLQKFARQRNLMKRFNDDLRAKNILSWSTQLFNLVQSTTVQTPALLVNDLIALGLHNAGIRVGNTQEVAPLPRLRDILLPYAYMFSSQKALAAGALSNFPTAYFKVMAGLMGDVNLEPEPESVKTQSRTIIGRTAHKWFDLQEKVNEKLSTFTFAKMQEFHVRAAHVVATLDQIVRRKSGGQETLASVMAANNLRRYITAEEAEYAARRALLATAATEIEGQVGREFKRAYNYLDNYLPLVLNPITYARFLYTTTMSLVVNPLTFGALDKAGKDGEPGKMFGGRGYNTRSIAWGIQGYGLLVAMGLLKSMLGDKDDDWYVIRIADQPIDMRRFWPLSAYLWLADRFKKTIQGAPLPTPNDVLEGLASLETDFFLYGAGVDFVTTLYDKAIGRKAWGDLGASVARLGGNILASYAAFFRPFKYIVSQFSEEEAAVKVFKDTAKDKFLNELNRTVPFVARLSDAEKVRGVDNEVATVPFPLGRLIGLNFIHKDLVAPKKTPALLTAERLLAYSGPQREMSPEEKQAFKERTIIKNAIRREGGSQRVMRAIWRYKQKYGERKAERLLTELRIGPLAAIIKYNVGFDEKKDIQALRSIWALATDEEKQQIRRVLAEKRSRTPEMNREFNLPPR